MFQPLASQEYGSTTNNKSTFVVGTGGQINWTKKNGIYGGGYLNEDLSDNQTYLEGRAFWGRLTFHGTEETTIVLAGSLYSFEGSSETSTFFPSQTTLYLSGETTSPATVLGFPGQLPLKPISHGAFVQ